MYILYMIHYTSIIYTYLFSYYIYMHIYIYYHILCVCACVELTQDCPMRIGSLKWKNQVRNLDL